VIVYYAATSIAITTHRIFDARQLILIGVQKCLLVLVVAGLAFGLDSILGHVLPEPFAFLLTTALMLGFASKFSAWLDFYFNFYPQATAARVACLQALKAEASIEKLEFEFSKILKGWGHSDEVFVAYGQKSISRHSDPRIDLSGTLVDLLKLLRWATPERLTREKPTPERQELARFLEQHGLGVLVLAEGPSLTAVIGVGVGASRRPYTYPQVTQLLELASIMESALERAHFSAKVQHAEQLATVGLLGASMAHEIRNPLVSIKTFVQLLPTHYQDPAFRDKFFRLIGSEVSRIDQLTQQLLDLSTPRTYAATRQSLHAVLQSSLDLVTAKAADQGVEVRTAFAADPDAVYTDAAASRQVMLNLCFNAIQAVEAHESAERWIRIATRNTPAGVEMTVTDSGPGIAPEMQQRLFQPFQTTKSSGFGLGLAICRDILANLGATITVDPSVPAAGATFRVVFPCQASSS
jgi:signal transduction histidine kinase